MPIAAVMRATVNKDGSIRIRDMSNLLGAPDGAISVYSFRTSAGKLDRVQDTRAATKRGIEPDLDRLSGKSRAGRQGLPELYRVDVDGAIGEGGAARRS